MLLQLDGFQDLNQLLEFHHHLLHTAALHLTIMIITVMIMITMMTMTRPTEAIMINAMITKTIAPEAISYDDGDDDDIMTMVTMTRIRITMITMTRIRITMITVNKDKDHNDNDKQG